MLITPWSVSVMLEVIIDIGKTLNDTGVVDHPIESIAKVPYCNNGYYYNPKKEEPCLSVGFSIIGDSSNLQEPKYQRYHDLMQIFSKNNEFEYGKDVRPLTAGKQKDLLNYVEQH